MDIKCVPEAAASDSSGALPLACPGTSSQMIRVFPATFPPVSVLLDAETLLSSPAFLSVPVSGRSCWCFNREQRSRADEKGPSLCSIIPRAPAPPMLPASAADRKSVV